MNTKIVVFPYNAFAYPIVNYLLKCGYSVYPLSLSGTGLINKDVSLSINSQTIGVNVYDYSTFTFSSDMDVYLVNSPIESPMHEKSIEFLEMIANLNNIRIFKNSMLILEEYPSIKNIHNFTQNYDYLKHNERNFYNVNIPVVFVSGIIDTIDNSVISLSLIKELRCKGMNAQLISNDCNSEFAFTYLFPREFMNNGLSIESRISILNDFIRFICETNKPDILLMQIPKGLLRYDDSFYNSFGAYTFMISEAVTCDYFICSFPYELCNIAYFDLINDYVNRKLNTNISSIHMSSISLRHDITQTKTGEPQLMYNLRYDFNELNYHNSEDYLIGDFHNSEFVKKISNQITKIWKGD